ncbi:hypothetical protein [uncultured Methanobrevibacter sp.]|uniref:hypothetical protein n=1 Tax=uncultured Methanobrevibacter sp. TaxID=253161 RepID=UPI0025E8F1E8|nr:hypothetical protein [uncultured Methanobrevibacter sp.]
MDFSFSWVGLLFLVMLFAPNILWSRCPPKDYDKYSKNENKLSLALERIGQVLVVVLSLFCGVNFSFNIIFLIAFLLMVIYEIYWIRYFRSQKTMNDMYDNFLFIPLPGATLPVIAFFLLGVCANNVFLVMSSIILGIGHIGIHLGHKREIS